MSGFEDPCDAAPACSYELTQLAERNLHMPRPTRSELAAIALTAAATLAIFMVNLALGMFWNPAVVPDFVLVALQCVWTLPLLAMAYRFRRLRILALAAFVPLALFAAYVTLAMLVFRPNIAELASVEICQGRSRLQLVLDGILVYRGFTVYQTRANGLLIVHIWGDGGYDALDHSPPDLEAVHFEGAPNGAVDVCVPVDYIDRLLGADPADYRDCGQAGTLRIKRIDTAALCEQGPFEW